jgi:hypothetical protein
VAAQYLTVYTFVCPPSEQGSSQSLSPLDAAPAGVGHPRVAGKWLNVILDLNGILCVSKDRRFMPENQVYNVVSNAHSSVLPAAIGIKAVFVRPHCHDFLRELTLIANVSVWSSMVLTTTKAICEYLFRGVQSPILILGQNSCEVVKVRGPRNKLSNLKVKGTKKDLFLKPLDRLFDTVNSKFNAHDTIIIDDSRDKHVMNEPENVVLPESWTEAATSDRFLVDELLPWIQRLHRSRGQGLLSFRRDDDIGRRMLIEESNSDEYDELVALIETSRTLVHNLSIRP